MRTRPRTFAIALLLGALASAVGVLLLVIPDDGVPFVHRVTDLVVHVRALDRASALGLRAPGYDSEPNPDIGIIAIDDLSIGNGKAGLGSYPFPRDVYGALLTKLRAAGAKAVAFDIVFLEPSADPRQDRTFAAGMRNVPTVLAYAVNTTTSGQIGVEPLAPELRPNAAATGFSSVDEPGGVLIGQPMEIRTGSAGTHANARLVSLAAAAAQTYRASPLPLDRVPVLDGRMLLVPPALQSVQRVRARGGEAEMRGASFAGRGVLSFADAYTAPVASLRPFANNALIFIGATATGLSDLLTTARSVNTPGVFVNARFADQLLRSIFITAAPLWLNILLIVVLTLLIALSFCVLRPAVAIAVSLLAAALYAYAALALFVTRLVWIDLVHVVASMLLATMLVAAYRLLVEGAQRRMVTNLFGMHVSPAVVDDILKSDDPRAELALTGKRVKATIFYSDIRGFTAMSETMEPEAVYAQLNEYFDAMCTTIFAYGGYVDKFIGDCIMAVFSAPYQRPDDALRAVKAALEQQRTIRELCAGWEARGMRGFTVGMGINTGDVIMGNLGARSRMNYTVIGDNVNIAARLYNVAKGGEIIISETTYAEVGDAVLAEEREPVSVKGKLRPLRIYNVTGLRPGPATFPTAPAITSPA